MVTEEKAWKRQEVGEWGTLKKLKEVYYAESRSQERERMACCLEFLIHAVLLYTTSCLPHAALQTSVQVPSPPGSFP